MQEISPSTCRVVVMGIGYVGLPLVLELARAGFRVTGYDKSTERVAAIAGGQSYVAEVSPEDLAPHLRSGRLDATTDPAVLGEADAVIVCVPTPLNKTRDPDMQYIVSAAEEIAAHQKPELLVILESTTYPGTTTDLLVPKLTAGGQELGKDVFVAFSPERVDPGNERYHTRNTPKVIGGSTPACLERATALYQHIIDELVPVSSTETAEMVKLLENTFRAVNIGLVNEVAIMSRRLGVNPFEVIRAAATKPFGFMPFYPGPGLGGHCIPIDPLYLSWKLRTLKYQAKFIELADAVNSGMPSYVADRITDVLNSVGKAVRGAHVLVYGVSYKRDVGDVRESPAFDIIESLQQRGARVEYMDPFAPRLEDHGLSMESVPADASFATYDLVVIVTDHSKLDRERLLREARLVLDTRDALFGVPGDRSRVFGL